MEGIRRDTEAAELAERELHERKGAVLSGPESREALKSAGAETMPQAATLGEEMARRKAVIAAFEPAGHHGTRGSSAPIARDPLDDIPDYTSGIINALRQSERERLLQAEMGELERRANIRQALKSNGHEVDPLAVEEIYTKMQRGEHKTFIDLAQKLNAGEEEEIDLEVQALRRPDGILMPDKMRKAIDAAVDP